MTKDRTFALKNMREKGNTEYTKSETRLYDEILLNCFEGRWTKEEIEEVIEQQYTPLYMQSIEGIRVTKPPPRIDIAIPELDIAIRVMGKIHESSTARRKDWLQKTVLEGNEWDVIDVWQWEREDLWK